MYKKVANRISSPRTVQMEPEDLSSSPIPSVPTRGVGGLPSGSSGMGGSSSVPAAISVPGGPSATAAQAAAWALSNNKLLVFCDIVLKHANYPHAFLGEPSCDVEDHDGSEESCEETKSTILVKNERVSESPLNSVGESARESTRSSTSSTDSVLAELEPEEVDKETFESVSCWCGKPFAGRPMIECEKCLVWYHMSCEQIRRKNIPTLFQCSKCKEKRQKKRSSTNNSTTNGSSNAGDREESRRNSKGSSSSKKRKSSSFSSTSSTSSSSGIPGSASPQSSDTNLSPFPHAISQQHEEENQHHEATITSSIDGAPRVQDTPTKVPPPPPPLVKGSSPSRARYRKSKSSGGGQVSEKKRKSGENRKAPPGVAAASDSSRTTDPSVAAVDISNGLSSAAAALTVGDTVTHSQDVPPQPGSQPPRLWPCFENTTQLSLSDTDAIDVPIHHIDSHAPTHPDGSFNYRHTFHSNAFIPSSAQRSLPPPKLQPQVNVTRSSASLLSSSASPPPPLLLSSNFVVDHRHHQQTSQSQLLLRHAHQTGVVVGGGDNNPNHPYPFRQ